MEDIDTTLLTIHGDGVRLIEVIGEYMLTEDRILCKLALSKLLYMSTKNDKVQFDFSVIDPKDRLKKIIPASDPIWKVIRQQPLKLEEVENFILGNEASDIAVLVTGINKLS